ncbi:condensation domain-containing protein [Amycolatopsis sp. NBC_01286]|uniref:condensation domain-containing protein n=1 Tax=Amycolatopsis sp. NBC_01286 TaxID=2903560 RepID=UPI002E1653E9|nr:condensation domain-containing protein [Amycolatopsis sp. NBC_01286]
MSVVPPADSAFYRPASPAQRGMWLSWTLKPDKSMYVNVYAYLLSGPIDIRVLDEAFRDLLLEHEVLRTGLLQVEGSVVQYTKAPTDESALDVEDWSRRPVTAADIDTWISEQRNTPFDLSDPPLVRAALLRLDAQRAVLAVRLHHAVTDGESHRMLCTELTRLYRDCAAGRRSTAATYALPMRRVEQERRWLGSKEYVEALTHRLAELRRADIIEFPAPTDESPLVGSSVISIPRRQVGALLEHAQSMGVTPFSTLLTVVSGVLYRVSGKDKYIVGLAMSTRDESVENQFGYFVNLVPVALSFDEDMTAEDLLLSTSGSVMSGIMVRSIPFEELVASLPELRPVGRPPVVQVVFGVDDASDRNHRISIEGVNSENIPVAGSALEFDLECACTLTAEELVVRLYWCNALGDSHVASLLNEIDRTLRWLNTHLGSLVREWPVELRWER